MDKSFFISRRFRADLQNLSISAEMSKECCKRLKLDIKTCSAIDLAVSEAVSNAIRHSEKTETGNVVLSFASNGKTLTIEVEDEGPGFEFDKVSVPDLDIPQEGGYGIFLINNIMDSASYEQRKNTNVLIMTKKIPHKQMEKS